MGSYTLDKAYAIDEPNGVGAYRVVTHGECVGQATLPRMVNMTGILGVTIHSQSRQGGHVAVRKAGIARVTAAGKIDLGAPVCVEKGTGKIKMLDDGDQHVECLGYAETPAGCDGDICEVFIQIHQRTMISPRLAHTLDQLALEHDRYA